MGSNTIYGPGPSIIDDTMRGLLKKLRDRSVGDGKINLDTSEMPVAIWENATNRVILTKNWFLEIEKCIGKDAMGNQAWTKEDAPAQRELILKSCCVAMLPEKIAESVVDE